MKFLKGQLLKKHTSLRIGGPADYFCQPADREELRQALAFAREKKLKVAVLGAGSNILALDQGFRGLVIKLGRSLASWGVRRNTVAVGSGVLLPELIVRTARRGLGGLEFLAGIPGTIGGAVVMNAGAWGEAIGDHLLEIKALDRSGREKVFSGKSLRFGYRQSAFQNGKWIIVEAVLRLKKRDKRKIKEKIIEYLARRKSGQPLGIPNCGSVFRNPKGSFAGKLIEQAGCKGMRIGDAQVSTKHANFIVNLGEAKARDVIKLMTAVQKAVKPKLRPEVVIIG